MTDFYKVVSRLALLMLLVAPGYALRAQCVISNLQPSYCSDDPSVTLTGGNNVYGPGISSTIFSPSAAGVGTHTIYSSTYSTSTTGTFSPDGTSGTATTFDGNEDSPSINIGFNFTFFGQSYSTLVVNANGYVTFGSDAGTGASQALPSATAPNNLIAGAWDDLDIVPGAIETASVGSAPNRKFLITFTSVPYATGPGTVTFQIQLHESTNAIEIHNTNIDDNGGAGATQGIENATGTGGYAVLGRNASAWTASGDMVSFTPVCTDVHTVTVSAPPSNSLGVTAPATICPATGAPVTIASSEVGVAYQLRNVSDNSPLSAFYAGTGAAINIISSPLLVSTDIKVYANNSTTGCDTELISTVTVDPALEAPAIVGQPSNAVVCQGSTTTFTVDAGITSSPVYQWQLSTNGGGSFSDLSNDATYNGVSTASLSVGNIIPAMGGNIYRVRVSGTCTPPETSAWANLTVNQAAVITTQPTLATTCEDGTTQFSVVATGTGLTYQWYESPSTALSNGSVYSGVTTNVLTLTNVPSSYNGKTYYVEVTGSCTAAFNSNTVALTVNEKPEITAQPLSPTICENANTSFTINAGATTGVTYQWQVSTNGGVTYGNLSDDATYNGSATASLSLTTTPLSFNGYRYRVIVSGSCSPPVISNAAVLTVNQAAVITTQPTLATTCEDGTTQFSVVATGTGLTYQWYESPSTALNNSAIFSGVTTNVLTLTNVPSSYNGKTYYVEVTGSCTAAFNSNTVALTVNEKPEITAQPLSPTICENANTSFTINAGATTGVTYQWQVSTNGGVTYGNLSDDATYNGSATASLSLTTTPLSFNGYRYRVIVSGSCSPPVISNAAVLTVNQAAVITTQPTLATTCEDGTTQFSVVATGTGLTYQWYESPSTALSNGSVYSGVTTNVLTLTNVPSSLNGTTYYVEVTGACTAAFNSNTVALTVNEKPEITAQPLSTTICQNANTSFTINAGATTGVTYQWQVSTNGGVTYGNLSDDATYNGSATASLSLTTTPLSFNGYRYRVIVSGSCSPPVISNAAVLTVNQAAVITTQPTLATTCEDGTTQFSVVATGTGLTYQWYESPSTALNNSAIFSGVTTNVLTLTNVPSSYNGKTYYVEVTGSCTAAFNSNTVALTVNEKPEITSQPVSSIICQNANTSFTINAGATTGVTYQWQVSTNGGVTYGNLSDDATYNGSATASLSLTTTPLSFNGYRYRVIVSGSCSPPVISNAAVLTVNQAAVITTQPTLATTCEDGTTQFSVVATGTGLTYQWYESPSTALNNSAIFSGVTTNVLTLTNVPSSYNGKTYYVEVTGSCTAAFNSNTVALTVNEKPEITSQPVSSIICQNANTSFTINAGATTGVTYQWQVSTNGGVTYGNLSDDATYNGSATASLSLTTTPLSFNGYRYRVIVSGSCSPPVISNAAVLTVNQAAVITTQPTLATTCEDGTTQFSVVATGTGLTYQWYESPSTALSNGSVYSGVTTNVLTLINVPSSLNGTTYYVEVTGACTAAFNSNTVALTVNEKPEITAQPLSPTICENANTSFTINAGATTGVTYQWQVSTNGGVTYGNLSDDATYNGSATASLSLTTTPLSFNGYRYRVIVSGSCSPPVISNAAVLTVNQAAVITTQPTLATTCEDGTTQFSVVATGTGLTYQWYESPSTALNNSAIFSGVTTSVLTLTNVPSSLNGTTYYVEVTGACTAAFNSNTVALTVNEKPEITAQPLSPTICENANTSFTINAGATTGVTYQWQVSTNGGVTYSNLSNDAVYSGVSTNELDLTATPLSFNSYLYRVLVSGSCIPPVVSNGAALTVYQNPIINVEPIDRSICEGSGTTFTVVSVGQGLTYQWQENGVNIANGGVYAGATSPTLVLSNVPVSLNGKTYSVVITGTCGIVSSTPVALTVRRVPDAFASDASICSGQTTNVVITNPNSVPSTSFSWIVQSVNNVSGASPGSGNTIAQTLTATDGVTSGSVTYLIQPSAAACIGTPYAVTVMVAPLPNAAASPQTICSGSVSNVVISNPNGVAGTTYTWTVFASSNVTGASAGSGAVIAQNLISTNGTTNGTVTYRITPSSGTCSGTPIDVVVTVTPTPVMTNPVSTLIGEICSNAPLNFVPTSSVSGTTFTWTGTVIGSLTGVSATGSGPVNDTPQNATNTNAVIIYSITPHVGSCSGTPINYVVTVRPVTSASASPQTICSGSTTSVAITNPNSVSGTTYTWSVLSANATGASAGAGNVISQVLTSSDGITNGTVTYTITPWAYGCPGPSFPVNVTVKPVPVLTNPSTSLSQTICSGEPLSFMPTASIGSTSFSWTTSFTGPIDPSSITASGVGNITQTPANTGNVMGTVTYRITPNYNGCAGPVVDYVVMVKPLPSVTASPVTICSGQTVLINLLSTPKSIAGTTYAWTVSASPNVVGALAGDGSVISQQLTSTNASIGTVTYTITPMANGCVGPAINVIVTVNPIAVVNAGPDYAVCQPATVPLTGTIGGSATSGTWTIVSGGGTLSASTTTGGNVTATYTVHSGDIGGSVVFQLATNDPDGAGPCSILSDNITIAVNRAATVSVPSDYVVCEPSAINISGTLGGSGTSGLWSLLTGTGTLSATSVTGTVVTSSYQPSASDVGTVLRFRLTSNDPDGSGPCLAAFNDLKITINQAARINAGPDFAVCEDQSISLAAIAGGATTSVLWSGGSGAAQFSPVNNVNSTYALTPADITAGGVTLNIATNDPDAGGPCTSRSDQVFVRINKLPSVFLVGLESVYAENSGIDNLDGFPVGGVFTGPGIVAGTSQFNPANAGFGSITIRYTYTDPITTCVNFTERTTIVNPVTNVDFFILEDNRPNAMGNPQICANQGELTLMGIPAASEGVAAGTKFRALSPALIPRISNIGTDWKINTNGLLAGTYQLQYIFTNEYLATDTLTRDLIVFSAPQAVITVGNNCIEDVLTFTQSSTIPDNLSNGAIINWNWLYDEGSNGSTGSTAEPQYQYMDPGTKNISLEVVTNQGCRNKANKSIVVGKPPTPDFNWSAYCKGDATRFADQSISAFGAINTYSWTFGDGNTSGARNPTHTYSTFGSFPVTLTISTDAGCNADTTKQVYIQELRVLSDNAPYHINFENGPETWVPVTTPGDTTNSWIFGLPNGEVIKSASSGSNAFWTGGNNGSYYDNEKSFVIGPCLNLTALKRPMISLNYWIDTQDRFDGAVVQYSVDGGSNWQTIGDAEGGGIKWYNSRNVPGSPGGQSNFAWSEEWIEGRNETKWTNARFNLDQIPHNVRDTVILRIAFGSNDDNLPGRALNGFAFDDIFVGEKTRNVLVEHFVNTNSTVSNQATNYLKTQYRNQFIGKDSSDFVFIEYHIPFGSNKDQINLDNPQDPVARALFYNVSQPPNSIMDGIQSSYFNGFTANINAEELDRQALKDPRFRITLDTLNSPGATNTSVRATAIFTYSDSVQTLNNRVTMNVALVERGVGTNGPVVRKLLLGSQGKTFERSWAIGDQEVVNIQYEIDVPIVNSDSVFLIAFIQNNVVASSQFKEVLQTRVLNLRSKQGQNITSIEDNPVTAELQDLSLYPNPVSNTLKITVPGTLGKQYSWRMIDQRGVTVLDGQLKQDFTDGPQEIDVGGLANGIYFMSIQTGTQSVVYRKVAVMNRN